MKVWREVAHRYAFVEFDGPPLEPLELYTKKSGDEIVGQLYNFVDKGEREVALRPEMTPTFARMVGARANAMRKPIRWFSIPQLFRYERQQRGRLREHFQLNMDIIGEASPLADAELMAAAVDIMRAFGLGPKDVQLRVSDRRVLKALLLSHGVTEAQLPAAFAVIDRSERVPKNVLEEMLRESGFGSRETEAVFDVAVLKGPDALKAAGEAAGPLNEAVAALEAMGLGGFVSIDLTIVRGLAYYTGIVFELFDAQKTLRAIAGGGRYDGLLDLPALGFGMGDVVLGELLRERGVAPKASTQLGAFLIAVGGDDLPTVLQLAHALRERGVAVEYGLRHTGVRKQLELASARGAARAVIIGPEERAQELAVVRDLRTGNEAKLPLRQLLNGYFD
jgi:histidyl-tRNA synthetase